MEGRKKRKEEGKKGGSHSLCPIECPTSYPIDQKEPLFLELLFPVLGQQFYICVAFQPRLEGEERNKPTNLGNSPPDRS